jgi:hypothetical protein
MTVTVLPKFDGRVPRCAPQEMIKEKSALQSHDFRGCLTGTSLTRRGLSGPARKLSLCSEADVAAADDCLEGWACQVFDRSYWLLPSLISKIIV